MHENFVLRKCEIHYIKKKEEKSLLKKEENFQASFLPPPSKFFENSLHLFFVMNTKICIFGKSGFNEKLFSSQKTLLTHKSALNFHERMNYVVWEINVCMLRSQHSLLSLATLNLPHYFPSHIIMHKFVQVYFVNSLIMRSFLLHY